MNIKSGKDLLVASADVWISSLETYDGVIEAIAHSNSKKKDLPELDSWKNNDLPRIVSSRNPAYLKKDELSKLIRWKLLRGKFRPLLQKYIDQLDSSVVEKVTSNAFTLLKKGNLSGAIDECTTLKGVGPAFSSSILNIVDPSVPYMSDEALEVVVGTRRYIKGELLDLTNHLRKLSGTLNRENLSPINLERAIFAVYHEKDVTSNVTSNKKMRFS